MILEFSVLFKVISVDGMETTMISKLHDMPSGM